MDYNAPGVKSQPPDGLFLRWLPNEDHSEIVDDDDVLFDDERADRTQKCTGAAFNLKTQEAQSMDGADDAPDAESEQTRFDAIQAAIKSMSKAEFHSGRERVRLVMVDDKKLSRSTIQLGTRLLDLLNLDNG